MNRTNTADTRSRLRILIFLAVFALGLLCFSQAPANTCDAVLPGLVGHYPFDNNAEDATANANHETAFGGVA